MRRLLLLSFLALLVSCNASTSSSVSSISFWSGDPTAWHGNLVHDSLRYSDGLYASPHFDDLNGIKGRSGDLFVDEATGQVATWLGEETLETGLVASTQENGWHKGWYCLQRKELCHPLPVFHLGTNGIAHRVENALYRTAFATNGHLETSYQSGGFLSKRTVSVELGKCAVSEKTTMDGDDDAPTKERFSWVENGVVHYWNKGEYHEGKDKDAWKYYQWDDRCLDPSKCVSGINGFLQNLDSAVDLRNHTYSVVYYSQAIILEKREVVVRLSEDDAYIESIVEKIEQVNSSEVANIETITRIYSNIGATNVVIPAYAKMGSR